MIQYTIVFPPHQHSRRGLDLKGQGVEAAGQAAHHRSGVLLSNSAVQKSSSKGPFPFNAPFPHYLYSLQWVINMIDILWWNWPWAIIPTATAARSRRWTQTSWWWGQRLGGVVTVIGGKWTNTTRKSSCSSTTLLIFFMGIDKPVVVVQVSWGLVPLGPGVWQLTAWWTHPSSFKNSREITAVLC